MFDDYSTENNFEDDQDMFSSSNITADIFNNDIPWSLHYLPSSENLSPFEEIFPSYLNDPFDHNNARVDISDGIIIRNENMEVNESSMETQQLPRKRSVLSSKKKDRHSKIDTARGLRDRRMRLSREVARQFFDLQDMLGVDKASEAIEWLLVQSSSAIKALPNYASTSTDCGLLSSHDLSEKKKKTREQTTSLQKDASAVRESREKARARAKQRTREKMLVQTLN